MLNSRSCSVVGWRGRMHGAKRWRERAGRSGNASSAELPLWITASVLLFIQLPADPGGHCRQRQNFRESGEYGGEWGQWRVASGEGGGMGSRDTAEIPRQAR